MKKIYENKLYKVVYMDFGCGFGKLYAVFSNNETEFNRSTMISARKKRYDAMHEADYLQSLAELKKPKCKYNKDGICVNADSENLADYCPIKEYEKEYKKRIENSFDFGRKTNQQYFQNYKLPEERTKTAKEIFDYIVKSGIIKVAPDTIKMFFRENYGVEEKQ